MQAAKKFLGKLLLLYFRLSLLFCIIVSPVLMKILMDLVD